jgi:hypothetical protein
MKVSTKKRLRDELQAAGKYGIVWEPFGRKPWRIACGERENHLRDDPKPGWPAGRPLEFVSAGEAVEFVKALEGLSK